MTSDPGRDVRVYRSSRHEGMYLFVDAADDLAPVPAALLQRFGKPVEAMSLTLSADRPLARADAARVLECLESDGYYLQLPPVSEGWSGS